MSPKLRMFLIEKAIEIVKQNGKKLTSKGISKEFNKMVKLMDIPLIKEETEETIIETYTM